MDTNDDGISFEPPRPEVAPPSGPPILPPPVFQAPFVPQEGAPSATVVPAGSVGKRSRGKVVGGLIAVVALVGAGGFAITKMVAGNDGGAASPTEVGTRFMDALGAEDALGVVDLLLPGERETMRQPLIDLVDNLKRLEIVDSTARLDKVGGLDVVFADVQVDPKPTNVDDISNIRIRATATASIDGDAVPIGDLLIDEAFGGDRPDLDAEPQATDLDWTMATVERDGRWYLSAFYSLAETARAGGDDIPGSPIVARGADDPEGAVQAIFDAVDDLDLEAMIAALNPNEAEALQRYAPMFIDAAQDSLDDVDVAIAFSDIEYSVTGDGDRRTVAIDAFNMTAGVEGDEVTVVSKDGCVVFTMADTTFNSCESGDLAGTALTDLGLDNEDMQALIGAVQEAFDDLEPVGVTVQQVDGKWFVSPIGTYGDVFLSVLEALDKGELTDIIDAARKVGDSLSAGAIFGIGDDTDSGDVGDIDIGDADTSGLEKCYEEFEYAAYSECVVTGMQDGSIDPSFVVPYDRFPECGAGEAYWTADVYDMSDEEFTAFATAAAPCFQQYIADGTISEFDLPYELSTPECLEGLNWYNNSTDEDYSDRVFACATS